MEREREEPFFSLILIVEEASSFLLDSTLKSIAAQEEKDFELIVVIDKALERNVPILENYRGCIRRVYSSISPARAFMLNKGIDLSRGNYLHFIFPGEFFLADRALQSLKHLASQERFPTFIGSGYVQRLILRKPEYRLEEITREKLKKGEVPLSLRPFFFRRGIFDRVGRFSSNYKRQPGFDLLCRIVGKKEISTLHLHQILNDSYVYKLKPRRILIQLGEILMIIHKYFGFGRAFFWWIAQNHLDFLLWGMRNLRRAFTTQN